MKKKTKELKKLFISCPTEHRELKDIKNTRARMQKIAEAIFDQELEVINGYPLDGPPFPIIEENMGRLDAYEIGIAMTQIAQADYYIGMHESIYFEYCNEQNAIARKCGIPDTYVSVYDVAKDAVDMAAKKMVDECMEKPSLKDIPIGEEIKPDWNTRLEVTPCYGDADIKIALLGHKIVNDPDWDTK